MLLAAIVLFFAFFVQSLAGFGTALIAMPVLVSLFGVTTAAPMFAILAQVGLLMMLARYRAAFNWRSVWRLMLAGCVAVPLGVRGAQLLDERTVTLLLGILTAGYGLYALSGLVVPRLHERWGYVFGFCFGLLAGAYNTGGPPVVIYGSSQGWDASEFKFNNAALFLVGGLTTIAAHWGAGNITPEVLEMALILTPVMIAGKLTGFALDERIPPQRFRQGVLVLLVVLGVSLIV